MNLRCGIAAVLFSFGGILPAMATQYTVTDLGTLGGSTSDAFAINARGQVVGSAATTGNTAIRPTLFSGNPNVDLGNLGGSIVNEATAINSGGVIVGTSALSGNTTAHAFVALGSTFVDIGTLGGSTSRAYGINDAGQIAGYAQIGGNTATHAFRYQNGQMQDLGTLGSGSTFGYGINAAGHVVGESLSGSIRAILATANTFVNLGTLGSGNESIAYAINDNDQIVGSANIVNGGPDHPFLYQNGQMQDLGTLGGSSGIAYAINVSTQIVGESQTTNNAATHAFLYQGGQMTDLNTLVPNSGWELTTARAINASGQIAGTGTINGQAHAYLLSPVQISPSSEAPRVYINGEKRIVTDRSHLRVEGSVGGTVSRVKYRIGKSAYKFASGAANGWRFRANLKIGRNAIQVIAVAPDGRTSPPAKVVIIRT